MPIGNNISLKDKLIKKTTYKKSIVSKANNTNITSKTNIKSRFGQPSRDPKTTTYKTKKMTFYIKEGILKKLYNFAYWERHNITEAFNRALLDGLKGKNTKPKE